MQSVTDGRTGEGLVGEDAGGSPTLTQRRMARTRRELAKAAGRLFASQGYDETTIEEIAAAAEVSPRTFYRYFAHKEGVVVALAQFGLDDVLAELRRRLPGEPLPEALAETVATVVAKDQADPSGDGEAEARAFFQMVRQIPALRARWLDEIFQRQAELAEVLATAYPALADDPLWPPVAAGAVLAAVSAAFELWAAGELAGPLDQVVAQALEVLARPFGQPSAKRGRSTRGL
jgi:AcrR family transcriptional regulator